MKISFNKPLFLGTELENVKQVIQSNKVCGDGTFTNQCNAWFENRFGVEKALLTTSCTHALEMAAILSDVREGDEVILPSYTFVSTANAFLLRGAKLVFVDVRPDTMNINEDLIESAITNKTKAIVVVHYAGVSCEMDTIMEIAVRHHLFVIEDAAQGVMSTYQGKALGTIGHFGCYSFHETKNYTMGEGGCLLINDNFYIERSEIIREKGTDRSKFYRGEVDKYTWTDVGSSYLPSEINAAYLYAQLEKAEMVNEDRRKHWDLYYHQLQQMQIEGKIELPVVPKDCEHNAHMFYIKVKDVNERTRLIQYLKEKEIMAVFHYIPLHSTKMGLQSGRFHGEDDYTTKESERLLRLPMYYGLTTNEVERVTERISEFYA